MSDQKDSPPDWSRVERLNNPKPPAAKDSRAMVAGPAQLNPSPAVAPPTQVSIALPVEQPRDFISKLKANAKNRKAMMEALDAHYATQLDGLRAQLSAGLRVHKSKLDLQAEEYLKSLDAQHLEVLGQLGIRNADTR
ncbi:MAG TPA: hypothetical protein VKB78_04815, partial [Pirellulales bacterium]|nr:hypothetical protein [Pirellulales bacterium]